jgi:hypothetical protein
MNAMGESNSVLGNLFAASYWEEDDHTDDEPMLHQAKRGLLAEPDYQARLRQLYSIGENGRISIDPDLAQQTDADIPVAAVWLQAAIDTGRLKDTQFADKEIPAILDELTGENAKVLHELSKADYKQFKAILDKTDTLDGNIEVPVEAMYFVAPHKDADRWLKVMARSPHKPAGILLYDDKKVRLENFGNLHKGDHTELTKELQAAIKPDNDKYIDYTQVLGAEFDDGMRAGKKHQVIAERYLGNRHAITLSAGKLVVEK